MSVNPNPDPAGSSQPPAGPPQQPYYGQTPPQGPPPYYQGQPPPQWQAPPPRHSHRPDFVLPLLLIAVGVLFLLNQFGYNINWAVVWPILLIVLGVGIIFSRGRTPGWVVVILVIVIVAAVVFTVLPNVIPGFPNIFGGSSLQLGEVTTSTARASQTDLASAKTLRVQVDSSFGSFTLHPDASLGSTAVQLVTTSNIKDLAAPTLALSGSAYQVSLPAQPWDWFGGWIFNWNNVRLDRDLAINSTLPLDLQLGVTSRQGHAGHQCQSDRPTTTEDDLRRNELERGYQKRPLCHPTSSLTSPAAWPTHRTWASPTSPVWTSVSLPAAAVLRYRGSPLVRTELPCTSHLGTSGCWCRKGLATASPRTAPPVRFRWTAVPIRTKIMNRPTMLPRPSSWIWT